MNFLEQIVSEWYAYKGYLVRTNIKFGKLKNGGYKGEIDVIAFDPNRKELVHIETSTDADSWEKRKVRFTRKFKDAAEYYPKLFPFHKGEINKLALVGFTKPKESPEFGDSIKIVSVPEFFYKIANELKNQDPMKNAIPENYSLLRAVQYSAFYGSQVRWNK